MPGYRVPHYELVLRVYLDQNAWIRLARVSNGIDTDQPGVDALHAVRETRRLGTVSYPLSWIHYFETYRKRDPSARQRLGEFMSEISDFHSMVGATAVLEHEISTAIARLQHNLEPSAPRVFGRGHAHAFGRPEIDLTEEPYRSAVAREGEQSVRNAIELEMLRGPAHALPFGGMQPPQHVGSQHQLDLEKQLEADLLKHGRSGDLANRIVLSQESLDLAPYIPDELLPKGATHSGIPKSRKFMTDLLLSLPAKGAITRMRMTAHQNPNFQWKIGDLNDMMALGMASAYCDVVVAEKIWGNVLQRNSKHIRAVVLTDVVNLPSAIATVG